MTLNEETRELNEEQHSTIKKLYEPFVDSLSTEIRGIIHIGSNECDEYEVYTELFDLTNEQIVFIDCLPSSEYADKHPQYQIIQACLSSCSKQQTLHINNYAFTNGLLPVSIMNASMLEKFENVATVQVQTIPFDALLRNEIVKEFNLLVVTTNGTEKQVLQGATNTLKDHIDYVMVTVSKLPLFEGQNTEEDVTSFLSTLDFSLIKRETQGCMNRILYAKNGKK
jgi:FkbM family methyltransferase